MDGEGPIEGRTRDDRDGDSSGAGHGEYRAFVMTAGGGVTVSGGESLLQPAFTAAVLRRCKECGLYTALDTSGFLGARAEDALIGDRPRAAGHQGLRRRRLPHADGGDLAPILEFARRLDRLGARMWIRYVLVPGWTDDLKAVDGLAGSSQGCTASNASTFCRSTSSERRSTSNSPSRSPCGTRRYPIPR